MRSIWMLLLQTLELNTGAFWKNYALLTLVRTHTFVSTHTCDAERALFYSGQALHCAQLGDASARLLIIKIRKLAAICTQKSAEQLLFVWLFSGNCLGFCYHDNQVVYEKLCGGGSKL